MNEQPRRPVGPQSALVTLSVTTMLTVVGDANAQSGVREDDSEKMLPISLKCPAINGQVLELISQNQSGDKGRVRVYYEDGQVRRFIFDYRAAGEPLERNDYVDLKLDKDQLSQTRGVAWSTMANVLKTKVCEGTSLVRDEYFDRLRNNVRKLGANPEEVMGEPQPKR